MIWYGKDMQKQNKIKTSFTLMPKVKALIVILSEKLAISQTSVVQMAIVKLAEQENVNIEDEAG